MTMRAMMAGAAMVAAALSGSGAEAQVVQAGTLTCEVAAGTGLVIGSRKDITCTFLNAAREIEVYDGSIATLGLDIGTTDRTQIVWGVFAPSGNVVRGAIAGHYVGATAQATLGAGLGANVLVGGSRRSVTLQPLSVSEQSGFNVVAASAELDLRLRRPERAARGRS